MGLWSRVKRSMRALFGGIIEKTEDPELILQQTIRDMRDRVPELNNSVAQVMATEKLLAKSKERLESQVVDLDSKIRASVKNGRLTLPLRFPHDGSVGGPPCGRLTFPTRTQTS